MAEPVGVDAVGVHRRAIRLDLRVLGLGHNPDGERGVQGIEKTPGRAALLTVLSILLTYLIVSTAAVMYAGIGTEGVGLGNEKIAHNVFGALAEPVLGKPCTPCSTSRCWPPAWPA